MGKVIPIRQDVGRRVEIERTAIGEFSPAFNLIQHLQTNRYDFSGGANFTVNSVPRYVMLCVERVKYRISKGEEVGYSPVIACCIWRGLDIFNDQSDVVKTLDLRRRFNLMDYQMETDFMEAVHLWLKHLPLTIPDLSMTGFENVSIRLPEDIKTRLYTVALGVGLSASMLSIICILESLGELPVVVLRSEHRKNMDQSLIRFRRRLRLQRVIASLLVDALSSGMLEIDEGLTGPLRVADYLRAELRKKINDYDGNTAVKIRSLIDACTVFKTVDDEEKGDV